MNNEQIVASVKKLRTFDDIDDTRKMIETSALLRLGKFDRIDVAWLEDQVLSMAKSDQRAVTSAMDELLLHLLKWKYQPKRRGSSWENSIRKQRNELSDISKTLRNHLESKLENCYRLAVNYAVTETNLKKSVFPTECEWDLTQILDDTFYPD